MQIKLTNRDLIPKWVQFVIWDPQFLCKQVSGIYILSSRLQSVLNCNKDVKTEMVPIAVVSAY